MNVTTLPIVNDEVINRITEIVKDSEELTVHTANVCRKTHRQRVINDNVFYWERIILSNDGKSIWHAIDGKGKNNVQQMDSNTTDIQFKQQFTQ